jgi:hypothetical protein
MQAAVQSFYRAQSATTDSGQRRPLDIDLPSDIGALVAVVQGLFIDKDLVGLYGLDLDGQTRLGEVDTRYASDVFLRLLEKDPRPLDQPREPGARFIGSCRDYALALCSMLRHLGVPTRLRFGFATYFSRKPDSFSDHCVCEYWHETENRWVLVDPNIDPTVRSRLGVTANALDLKRDEFVVAADGWRLARDGKVSPERFGVPSIGIQGLWFIRGSLMRDLAALNKVEMLPWDYWGLADRTPIETLPTTELAILDELSRVLERPNDLGLIRSTFSRPEYVVSGSLRSFSPLYGETKVLLR